MKLFHYLNCFALCAVLILPVEARSVGPYPDLPKTHWAYEDMDRAVELGIIKGMEDGRMAPEDTLTWGQYLTMLTRTFYPDTYAALTAAGVNWDQAGYWSARDRGLIEENDFLPVDPADLGAPILRQDAAALLERVLPENASHYGWQYLGHVSPAEERFSDWSALSESYQNALKRLYEAEVIRGQDGGEFGGSATVKRADGTAMLIRVADIVDAIRYGDEITVTLHIIDQQGIPLMEDQTVSTHIGATSWYLAEPLEYEAPLLSYTFYEASLSSISFFQDEYTLIYRPSSRGEMAEKEFNAAVERGELTWDDYWDQDFLLWFQGENSRKSLLLFGDREQLRFPDKQSAEANMTTVTVPVWHLDKSGNRVPATTSLTIHSAIAEDTVALFTEIYNDPEHFPIHDLGGYAWRGDSATGEHNCGTAVDINANENYQIREGKVLAGSHWKPGEDPCSIAPDSSVVRIFQEHGWSWGGDAWTWSSDDSEGYHDYMHFSYMGK